MSFHEILFPPCLEVFLVGKSLFSTSKIICSSGREIRALDDPYNREQFILKNCFLSNTEFLIFSNFFKARRGSRFAFLLKDFTDFSVQKQVVGVGDGASKEFQLCKSYSDESLPYIKRITKIKRDSLKVYIGDAEIQNWQFQQPSGSIVLENNLEQDRVLSTDFEFYKIVRFSEDSFDYQIRADGALEILNVSLIEVVE